MPRIRKRRIKCGQWLEKAPANREIYPIRVYAVAADGGRNAGADGFTTGISVAGVDGQRVAVAKHARVNVAEFLQFGKIGGVAAGI